MPPIHTSAALDAHQRALEWGDLHVAHTPIQDAVQTTPSHLLRINGACQAAFVVSSEDGVLDEAARTIIC